ncbi:unnamed protein product [Brassicogethes aeneus]|uniref:Uncharacterized protein n=1 Tax=Brassicogethes aeneus TaxID=1431903 RepID=A0A9P0B3Y9_BRAAE|nr:unnamed protein product [Brassicogethes aeneus]
MSVIFLILFWNLQAKAFANKDPDYVKVRRDIGKIQTSRALQLLEEAGVEIPEEGCGRGQDAILSGLKVDGFCENQVFEFQGYYYHGWPRCFKHQRDEPLSDDPTESMNFRYESTVAKIERLRAAGYDVIEKWECDFRREMRENTEIGKYVENHPLLSHSPLNPRDAFYGGRTRKLQDILQDQRG